MKQNSFSQQRLFYLLCIILVTSLTLSGCKKGSVAYVKNINGSDVVICPVNEVKDTVEIPLSSLVESCGIVRLENTPEGLIERAWHTEISGNHICIKTHGQYPAKLFDTAGKFLTNIGTIGRGPGEYSSLIGLAFSPPGDMLYLLPFGTTRKILAYDLSGNYVKDIPLAFTQRKFKAFFSPDSVITVLSMPFQGDSAICFQQTYDGTLIRKVTPPGYLIAGSFDGEIFTNYLSPEPDYFNTATDTLYHYNTVKNILEPKFAKDFGESKYISISKEIPGYYFFIFFNKENPSRKIIVDKNTLDANYFTLRNDFFGNLVVAPSFSNGYFINNIPAIALRKQIEKALGTDDLSESDRQKLVDFNKDLKPDDNNIIFYGKLKQAQAEN